MASPRSEFDYLMNTNKKLERKLTRIHLIQLAGKSIIRQTRSIAVIHQVVTNISLNHPVLISVAAIFLGIVLGLWPNPFHGDSGERKMTDNLFPTAFP